MPWPTTVRAAERMNALPALLPLCWIVLFLPLYLAMTRSHRFKEWVDAITPEYKLHRWGTDLLAMFLQITTYWLIVGWLSELPEPRFAS